MICTSIILQSVQRSPQRLKSHIGSMIRHNATITQIVLQQAVFGNSSKKENVSKRSVIKSRAQNKSQFKRVNAPIF